MSDHPELHHLIPWTANLEGKLILQPTTIPVDEKIALTTLTKLQGELNKKLVEVQVAADRLADYSKKLATAAVPGSDSNPAVATIAPPAAEAEEVVPPVCRGNLVAVPAVPGSDTNPAVAIIAPPAAEAEEVVTPVRRGNLVAVPAVARFNTNPAIATIASPAAVAEEVVAPIRRGNRKKKLTDKAQAAVDALK